MLVEQGSGVGVEQEKDGHALAPGPLFLGEALGSASTIPTLHSCQLTARFL